MFTVLSALCVLSLPAASPAPPVAPQVQVRKVAILPWSLKGGTEGGVRTVKETVVALFERTRHEVISPARAAAVWEEEMQKPRLKEAVRGDESMPDLPSPKDLLALGKKLNVDLVCVGRAMWHTKSVWVGLGPKTKADCIVDCLIIDVAKEEVALEARDVKADSTRKEAGLETAAALLISAGFTVLSGGPKDPHHRRAGAVAVAKAMDPWLKTIAGSSKKIGD